MLATSRRDSPGSLNARLAAAETKDVRASFVPTAASLAAAFAPAVKALSNLLLRWYLVESRKLEIPQAHDETIHTYPLA